MKISAAIKSKLNWLETIVETNGESKTIAIAPGVDGYGSSLKGGELLLVSLATCYCNNIHREAIKRELPVAVVEVIFTGEFEVEGEPGANSQYKVNVWSGASQNEIETLINYTDTIAVVQNILRKGLSITLTR
jgi:uncharacterized OsmC-like protein